LGLLAQQTMKPAYATTCYNGSGTPAIDSQHLTVYYRGGTTCGGTPEPYYIGTTVTLYFNGSAVSSAQDDVYNTYTTSASGNYVCHNGSYYAITTSNVAAPSQSPTVWATHC
jgi:hypothetical protein